MIMKKRKNWLTALLSMFVLASCSLEEDTSSFSTPDNFYQTKEQCLSALNSCYIPLNGTYNYTLFIATEACTDIMYINSGTLDSRLDISPAKPRHGETVWNNGYKGVMYCNAAINGIENSPLEENEKLPLLGEGKIMRAFYYYLLTSFFGDVPFYTEHVADVETQQKIGRLGRMSAVETREYLIKELSAIVPLMDQVRSSEVASNRTGAATGWMLIAKMAMWNKKWDTAIDAISKLEEIYGDLGQYPLEDVMFRNKNTPESIFEIQHSYVAGGLNYTSNLASICMPISRRSGTCEYDGVEIPELGDKSTCWTPWRPTAYFCQNLQTKIGGDLRAKYNMAWEYNGHAFKSVSTAPWPGPKFWCPYLDNSRDGNNYKIFRYADALLMKAECYCQLEQDPDIAMKYLNMTRNRAGIGDYPKFRTWARLMDEIQKERGRELIGEFQRKFDLVRWGIWYTQTYENTGSSSLKENIRPCHEYYPIPDTQVVYSGYALDNKAYDAYFGSTTPQ